MTNDANRIPVGGPLRSGLADTVAPGRTRIIVVTGLSGAGKSSALKALEDMGYEAVDNLPLSLFATLVQPGASPVRPMAMGVDIRTRDFGAENVLEWFDAMHGRSELAIHLLFVDCDDEVLRRRFSATRRRHPLAVDRPIIDGIEHERSLMLPLREHADVVIDTSNLTLGNLRLALQGHFGLDQQPGFTVFVMSFSYGHGLPREADLVFDVRFLANPHYEPRLNSRTGCDDEVGEFIAADPGFTPFFENLRNLLLPLLPRYDLEGKSYLTISVGCTGGRHRSVYVAERLAAWLREMGLRVNLSHRDIDRMSPG